MRYRQVIDGYLVPTLGGIRLQASFIRNRPRFTEGYPNPMKQIVCADGSHECAVSSTSRSSSKCTSWAQSRSSSGNASENGYWRVYSGPGRKERGSADLDRPSRLIGSCSYAGYADGATNDR